MELRKWAEVEALATLRTGRIVAEEVAVVTWPAEMPGWDAIGVAPCGEGRLQEVSFRVWTGQEVDREEVV